jgi:hypothetical protein
MASPVLRAYGQLTAATDPTTADSHPSTNQPAAPATPAATGANSVAQDSVTISAQAASLANNATASASSASATLLLEEQVQQLVSQGWSTDQISWSLNVPVSTVELYVGSPQGTSSPTATPAQSVI